MASAPDSAAVIALLRLGQRPAQEYSELLEDAGSALTVLERDLADPAGQLSLLTPEASGPAADHPAALPGHPPSPIDHPAPPAGHPPSPIDHPAPPAGHPPSPIDHPAPPAGHPPSPIDHPAPPAGHPPSPIDHPGSPAAAAALLIEAAEAEIAGWRASGYRVLTVLDAGYPVNLRHVHDRPPLLFVAGELAAADRRSVAVVGARRASAAGLALTGTIAEHLVAAGYVVVSGLAAGVDTVAHSAALAAGGRTVAVIGTGLSHSYPAQNAELQRRIAAEGAVVSQFWPQQPPTRQSFPMRNAVMSGLALGTVIVEASVRSGARVQARRALDHGRPVFLARALLDQAWAQQLAARPGVHVFDAPEEITTTIERLYATDALVE